MLTEYSSYDDIRKYRDKVHAKYSETKSGWLGKEISRQMIKWRQSWINRMEEIHKTFKIDNQTVYLRICPYCYDKETMNKRQWCFSLSTEVDTNKGKVVYAFPKTDKEIQVFTPHYTKRFKERYNSSYEVMVSASDKVQYIRNGKKYELLICDESILITRTFEDIRLFVTFLHRDMCTSKNYQELFERAGKAIEEHDIYEWE